MMIATILVAVVAATWVARRVRHAAAPTTVETRFRTLCEAAPSGVFAADGRASIIFVNHWLSEMTGLGAVGADWSKAIAAPDRDRLDHHWREAYATRTVMTLELRMLDARGEERWVELIARPEFGRSGAISGWIGTVLDIDARYRALAALRESERLHQLIADNTNDMIVRVGLDGVRRYVSPASIRILGYEPAELVGETPVSAIHPEDRARVQQVCRGLLDGADNPICTYRQLRKDGSYVWLESNYRLVRDAAGAPIEFIASVRDVGGRLQAELATAEKAARLEESYRLLQMGEAAAGVGHWRVDLVTQLLHWSDEVFRIHGLDRDQQPTLEAAIFAYHPDDRAMVQREIDEAVTRGGSYEFRARIIRPDGEVRDVCSVGQAEVAPNGLVVGLFGIFQDITRQVAIERELTAACDRAQAAADAQASFLAMMSHEIRTPMSGVVGMIELLGSATDEATREQAVRSIGQSTAILMRVLDDVLDHLKIEAGEIAIDACVFDFDECLAHLQALYQPSATAKGIELVYDDGAIGAVKGDQIRIAQIVANFVGNAVKFTAAGQVRIGAIRSGDIVRILVEDSGIGIDQRVLPGLFKPFSQGESSTARRFGGSGLGLSISARLAAAMGGRVGVDSIPRVGSRFWVDLPLPIATPAPAHVVVADHVPLVIDGRAPTILIVEDTETTRLVAETHLERMGCQVRGVASGIEALEILAVERFDVMLVDSAMPELDGASVIRLARLMPGSLPRIVGFTAHVGEDQHRALREAGIDAIVHKPFKAATLHAAVHGVLATTTRQPPAKRSLPVPPQLAAAVTRQLGQRLTILRAAHAASDQAGMIAGFAAFGRQGDLLGLDGVAAIGRFGATLARRFEPAQCGFAIPLCEASAATAFEKSADAPKRSSRRRLAA